MMRMRLIYFICILFLVSSILFGAWTFTVSVAETTFHSDILRIKQNFYQGIKASENILAAFRSFEEVESNLSQEKFGIYADDLMKNNSYLNTVHFYSYVTDKNRLEFENKLTNEKLGTVILEGGGEDNPQLAPAKKNAYYFPIYSVDNASKDSTYFGWNIYSDPSKKTAIDRLMKSNNTEASETFLLDSGNVAIEIFTPVYRKVNLSGEKTLAGIVGIVVDLTQLIGEEQWRKGVEIILSTTLGGESIEKDIFRQLDMEQNNQFIFKTIKSEYILQQFGENFKLKFKRELISSRINFGILYLAILGCIVLIFLAVYLIITNEKLKLSYKKLWEANDLLEMRVKERTKDLANAHAEIKEILDNLDDVVLTVTPDLKIGATYSPASLRILGESDLADKNLKDVLFNSLDAHNEADSRHLFALNCLPSFDEFQWSLTSSEFLNVISLNVKDNHRTLAVRYSPIFEKDSIQKVVIVASDITEILALKASLAAKEDESNIKEVILRENLLSNYGDLYYFYQEAESRYEILQKYENNINLQDAAIMLRELHTLKGSARSIGLKYFAKQVHILEDKFEPIRLAVSEKNESVPPFEKSSLNEVLKLYTEYRDVYKNLIERKSDSTPSGQALDSVSKFLSSNENKNEIIHQWIADFKKESFFSLKDLFSSFSNSIIEIGNGLDKKIDLKLPTWDLYFDTAIRPAISEAFTHSLRNAADHGIETQQERLEKGKQEFGTLNLEMQENKDSFVIKVVDNGRGVNLKKVYEIANTKGLVKKPFESINENEIIDLLFAPGFSTKEGITELSGRGVGLDAVRSSCEALGITCKISSVIERGSCFELILPRKYTLYLSNESSKLIKV